VSVVSDTALKGLGVLLSLSYKQHAPPSHPKPWSKTKKKPRETRPEKKERLKRLENTPVVPQLFQNNPDRLAIGFPPSGWTRTVEGYWKSARRRLKTVLENNRILRRRFTLLAVINLREPHHPALINRDFGAFEKRLTARGLIGHWTIHIDRKNVVHWHLEFVDCYRNPKSLKRLLERCLSEVETFPRHRVYTNKIRSQKQTLEYVLRVKKKGYGEVFNPLDKTTRRRPSRMSHDIYARDRILFKSKTGVKKNGTFGDFWVKGLNEGKLWKLICEQAETVARNYENPRIKAYVHLIHERLGIPFSRVKWQICLYPPAELLEHPSVSSSSPRRAMVTRRAAAGSSSWLAASIFPSAQPRHGVPAIAQANPRRLFSTEIGSGKGSDRSPHSALITPRSDWFSGCPDGLSHDTKTIQDDTSLWATVESWIRTISGLFIKKQVHDCGQTIYGMPP